MRTSKVSGRMRFSPEDHLTSSQVKSYFSKLTRIRRQQKQHLNSSSLDLITNFREVNHIDIPNDDDEDDSDDYDSLNEEIQRQQLRYEVNHILGSNTLWDDTDSDA